MIIELVGPGGTGKTTLSSNLGEEAGIKVLQVPPTKDAVALVRGVATASRLALPYRLRPIEWLSLARNCAAVEHAMRETGKLRGTWVVDEGPVRCLRERRCNPGAELDAWTCYARSVVKRLYSRKSRLRVVVVDLDREVRRRRYHERTRFEDAQRKAASGFRSRLGLYLDERLGSRNAPGQLGMIVDRLLRELGPAQIDEFTCSPEEQPVETAQRFTRTLLSRP